MDPSSTSSGSSGPRTSDYVHQAIAGDLDSIGWVVSRQSPLLLAHAEYRMGEVLRRHHDPEDLVNDAWLVALPRLAELPAREGRYTPVLLKFLATTLLNRVRNLARKHTRGVPIGGRDGTDPVQRIPAETSGVVTRAVRREQLGDERARGHSGS